ncbi:hypothetical protein ACR92P_26420, partial [Klebsiella pneumoniae]
TQPATGETYPKSDLFNKADQNTAAVCVIGMTRDLTLLLSKNSAYSKIAYYLKRNLLQKHSVEICSIQQSPFYGKYYDI